MRRLGYGSLAVANALLVLLSACGEAPPPEGEVETDAGVVAESAAPEYLPVVEDSAIMFTHRFIPAEYENGKRIVVEGFGEAIQASGQTRRTYFLDRPDSAEVVTIAFFHSSSSTTEWLNSDIRERVLAQLRPHFREPLEITHFHAEYVHDTHQGTDEGPGYLPEEGDEVVLLAHRFAPDTYDAGRTSVVDAFSRNLSEAGQTQRSYFLDSPGNQSIVVASFVHPDSRADAWLEHELQRESHAALEPLRQDSLVVRRYVVAGVHNVN